MSSTLKFHCEGIIKDITSEFNVRTSNEEVQLHYLSSTAFLYNWLLPSHEVSEKTHDSRPVKQ